ncbi:DNA alkylation repair protein [candidate division WOR-1 bacterium RIFOXYB2_FULL_42_35]|uniref:DNA alkylation repair protein n=1 Tax=candidate division WOR-1 bacterium RIFOXYC2_FULL_41_25 TaxID=1802586 RepID=A0A1F4TL27_UNCSA|nr:MAG: DNA alkylation repair protein [candidate division WOR-1 bacterium RIFOXYA2_FULL_41_14]OGC21899.1 MAG: DNA alkylation repair protein [candidate division WOR-1 bacterium RIFOXYB2_FULL_42_35]OGC32763.1 MAG: DNA alkylation repair protein [candidate division WOR-1 bacterium RIFOXYC2_FULL_41_25]OGC42558.1 MAG: DNA alkylation repair protein [candidate division WOR-1 bacterium RIFOXYD2_FULL_41_8]
METVQQILKRLKSLANPANIAGMQRFGIKSAKMLGLSRPQLRQIAKETPKNHQLALDLWQTEYLEARVLGSLIDEPDKVTEKQIDAWVADFDNWDICDQCCTNLFRKLPFAFKKVNEWGNRSEEYVKRAGFALLAFMAVHAKKESDETFIKFFPLIKKASTDERNFVRKAVNWALRNIGKKNLKLNKAAIKLAKEIVQMDNRTAKWIAKDAIRELTSIAVIARLN